MTIKQSSNLYSLQTLRFVMIFLIFIDHFLGGQTPPFNYFGEYCTAFFFILSGFVISLRYDNKVLKTDFSHKAFFKKRISKIWPTHISLLLLALILSPSLPLFGGLGHAAKCVVNALLLQSWVPDSNFYWFGNAVAWFLSNMAFCYFLFPWISRFISRSSAKTLCIAGIFVLAIYFSLASVVPQGRVNDLLFVFPPARLLDFVIGMLLCRLYIYLDDKNLTVRTSNILEIVALVFSAAMMPLWYYAFPRQLATASLFWVPCALLILVFALTDKRPGIFGTLFHNKLLLWLGSISFEFFIVHWLVINLGQNWVTTVSRDIYAYWLMVVLAAVTIALAAGLHKAMPKVVDKMNNRGR